MTETQYHIELNSKAVRQHGAKRIKKLNRFVFVVNVFIVAFRLAIIVGSLALGWMSLTNPEYVRSLIENLK